MGYARKDVEKKKKFVRYHDIVNIESVKYFV